MNTESILRKLKSADRVWLQGMAIEWLLRSVKWACAIVLICVGADLLAQLGSTPRLLLTIFLGLGALALVAGFIWRGWWKSQPLLRVARHLENRDPALGSKLVNVLQLEEQAKDDQRPEMTRMLARQAIDEASANMSGHKFLPLVKSPTMRRSLVHGILPVAALVTLALSFSSIAFRQLERFLDPYGDHPPFSFTQLKIVSPIADGQGIIYKKPVSVEVEFDGHRPDELFLLIAPAADPTKETIVPMLPFGKDRFVQQIDEVTTDLQVRATTKDRRSISLIRTIPVILTPQLEKTKLKIEPPAYTKLKSRETELGLGKGAPPAVSALVGSKLEFSLTSNRPLGLGAAILKGSAASNPVDLTPGTGDTATIATALMEAKESGRVTFDLRDVSGLQADRELAAALTVTHDLPPQIEIAEPTQDGFIVDNFEAKLAVRISDDYGIRTTRMHLGINGKWNDPKIVTAQEDPPQCQGLEALTVLPSSVGAKSGDVLTFFGDVTDIRPEPQTATTRTLKLEVISEEQYNDLLRAETEVAELQEKYGSLHDEFDRLVREQRELSEAAEKADAAEQEKLAARQEELNQKLEKLAQKMETAVRDKPLYDMEKSLQNVLSKEAGKIRESIAKNSKDNAGAPSPKQLAQAGKEQADRLDPTAKQSREEIEQALADAQKMQDLVKPLTAFQALYEEQQDLASQTQAMKQKKELSREDRLAMQDMASRERMVSEGLQEIAKQLREKADAAEKEYPEAADDARNIADAMEDAGLDTMADRASRSMLAARSGESHDRAETLRAAMEKMMPECQSCKGGMGNEFAQRLSLARSMLAGSTFQQMAMCKKFGFGKPGSGMGMGMGSGGVGGMMATGTVGNRPQRSMLGSESKLGRRDAKESANTSKGQANGNASPGAGLAQDTLVPDPSRANATKPDSTSSTVDSSADEYSAAVDAYFRKLTAPKP